MPVVQGAFDLPVTFDDHFAMGVAVGALAQTDHGFDPWILKAGDR